MVGEAAPPARGAGRGRRRERGLFLSFQLAGRLARRVHQRPLRAVDARRDAAARRAAASRLRRC